MAAPPLDGTVLITGASSGIGTELARQLAPEARELVLVARRRDRLDALRDELVARRPALKVRVEPCDLSRPEDVRALLGRLADDDLDVDVLVNNAGLGDIALLEDADPSKLDQMIAVNVSALTQLTRALFPAMVRRGRGGVLNVSSGFGLTFMPAVAVYVGTKYYVTGFTEALRLEAVGTGVAVTQVCPGPVATEFEAIAGNPTGQKVPGFVEIGPEACARAALRGFRRDRAIVIPGLFIGIVMRLERWTPRWFLRLMYRPLAGMLRRRRDAPAAG